MQVLWDQNKCSHSGNCVRGLPKVFKIEDGAFVIEPGAATSERVRQQVAECPSKALSIKEGEHA